MSNNVIKNNYLNTTTHSGIARTMVQTLDSYGQDSAQIFADAGLDAANSQGADQRVVEAHILRLAFRAAPIVSRAHAKVGC